MTILNDANHSIMRGYSIVALRNYFGLSLRQFADKIGYSYRGVIGAEKVAVKPISLRLEYAICKAFDLCEEDVQALAIIDTANNWKRHKNDKSKVKPPFKYVEGVYFSELGAFYNVIAPLLAEAKGKR